MESSEKDLPYNVYATGIINDTEHIDNWILPMTKSELRARLVGAYMAGMRYAYEIAKGEKD
jgi:hypothetical protein